jgi:hypothetical protein
MPELAANACHNCFVFRCHVDPLARASRTAVRRPCSRWLATFVRARNPSFSDGIRKFQLSLLAGRLRRSWTSATSDANRFLLRRYIGGNGGNEKKKVPSAKSQACVLKASSRPPWLGSAGCRASKLFVHLPATKLAKRTCFAKFFEHAYGSGRLTGQELTVVVSFLSSPRVCGRRRDG